jgi:hypothetical protein
LRSIAIDAAASTQLAKTEPDLRTIQTFMDVICSCETQWFKGVGSGDDLRFASDQISGGALVAQDRVVHLSAFNLHL